MQVDETGITGMVPISSMPDFFIYNESAHELKGRSSGTVYKLGERIDVELQDVNVLTGQIAFHLRTKRSGPQKQPTVSVGPTSKPKKRR